MAMTRFDLLPQYYSAKRRNSTQKLLKIKINNWPSSSPYKEQNGQIKIAYNKN